MLMIIIAIMVPSLHGLKAIIEICGIIVSEK